MAPRHKPGLTHPVLPPHLQPMVGPCFSLGRNSPRASIQACCCFNRRLYHGLGGHVQRACSRRALDRAPAAVAYKLPRVAGSMACSAPLQNAATREAYTGPAKNCCAFARALLLYPHRGAGCTWRNTHGNCHWLVLLTLEGDWALRRDPISQSL